MIKTLGRREIKFSLDSSDLLYSNTLANVYNYSIEKFFKQVRMFGTLEPKLQEIIRTYFWENVKKVGLAGLLYNEGYQKSKVTDYHVEQMNKLAKPAPRLKYDKNYCSFIRDGEGQLLISDYLQQRNISLNSESFEFKMICKYFNEADRDVTQVIANYTVGNYDHTEFERKYGSAMPSQPQPQYIPPAPLPEAKKAYMLSEAIKAYIDESKASGITDKSISEYSSALDLFMRVQGDSDVTTITREQLVKTKTILAKLPPNLNKKNAYKNKSIEQIIRLKHTPVSQTTLNNYMIRISQLFTWMEKYGKIQNNIAKDLTTKIKTSNRDYRDIFIDDMIAAFFTSSEYLVTDKPENHWIPLIALFSGMRQNEICQLYVDDIKSKEGIYYFDINSDRDKQIKNKSAERMVPIHQTLIDLGFISYAEACRAKKHTRLWKNLLKGRDGYGTAFSQRVNRLIDNVVTTDSKVNFHSFRHTFANQMKQTSGIDLNIIEELLGHSRGSETADRYGKAYEPTVSIPEVNKLRYSFDFSFLKGKLLLKP